jgi:hypothetical protein
VSEYKRTLFDKHGPAAVDRIRALSYGAMIFGLTFGAVALTAHGISVLTLVLALLAAGASAGATLLLSKGVGGGVAAIALSGASTPSEDQYSYQQALVMQGKVNEALASYEDAIAERPGEATPRILAADLYATLPDGRRRAAELFREVQRMPGVAGGQDIYATNRLVDLLTGPLRDPGRAAVELRRLIERHPTSTAATHARAALARIKQTLAERELDR